MFPIRRKSLDRRIDEYEKTPICNGGSPRAHIKENFHGLKNILNGDLITISSEMILLFFMFIIFIFIVMHFNASINKIKKMLKQIQREYNEK